MAEADALRDAAGRQAVADELPQGHRVEQRLRHGPTEETPERDVAHQVERADRERAHVAAEHMLHLEPTPEARELGGRVPQVPAARGDHGAVDRSGRRAGDDLERRWPVGQRGYLADAL